MGESWATPSAGSHSRSSRAVVISCVNTDLGTRPGFVVMAWRDPNEPALALEQPQPDVDSMSPVKITYRLATLGDADRLFELRWHSIIALAVSAMSTANANIWAARLTLA